MNLLIRFFAALLTFASVAAQASDGLDRAVGDLSPEGQKQISASVKSFLRDGPKEGRAASALGWDCLAALAMTRLEVDGARERLVGIAEALNSLTVRARGTGKAIGWSVPDEKEACTPAGPGAKGPAACASGKRIYAFESGIGLACLADAGAVLQRPELTATARDVMAYWNQHRMFKPPCKDCIYFATSDSASDSERYIRNMNLFVAFGAGELGRTTNDQAALDTARKSVRADMWERENGNRGYLGKLDPIWTSRAGEAERIENHAAFMALLIDSIGSTLKDPAVDRHALTVWRDWATCTEKRCKTVGCQYWGGDPQQCQATSTAVHCGFRKRDEQARSLCESYLARTKSVGSVGLWATLGAR